MGVVVIALVINPSTHDLRVFSSCCNRMDAVVGIVLEVVVAHVDSDYAVDVALVYSFVYPVAVEDYIRRVYSPVDIAVSDSRLLT